MRWIMVSELPVVVPVSTQSARAKQRMIRNTVSSRAIIALLIAFFVQAQVVQWYRDLPSVHSSADKLTDFQRIDIHVGRLFRFLNSFDNPETILFGSSTIQIPSIYTETEFYSSEVIENAPVREMIMLNLLHSSFLEHRVSTKLRRPASIVEVAVSGSVVKDDLLITQKILESGKQPKLFIYCMGQRDFLVNPSPRSDSDPRSPVERLFADYDLLPFLLKFSSPVINAFSYCGLIFEISPQYHSYLKWLHVMAANSRMKTYDLANQIQYSTLNIKGFRLVSQTAAAIAKLTEPPPSYYDKKTAKAASRPMSYVESISQPAIFPGLQYLSVLYTEKSIPYMNQNFEALEKIFQIAQAKHVRCLVVQMPFTARLKGVQTGIIAKLYDQKLAELLHKYNIPTWTPDAGETWSDKCFRDEVHLNLIGAKKLFSQLSDQISDFLCKLPTENNF